MPIEDLQNLLQTNTFTRKTPEELGITQSPSLIERATGASQKARQEGIATMREGSEQRILGETKREKTTGFLKEVQGSVEGTAGTVIAGLAGAAQPVIEGTAKIGEFMQTNFNKFLSAITPNVIEDPVKKQMVTEIKKAAEGGKLLWNELEPETQELLTQIPITAIQLADFVPFVEAPAIGRAAAGALETTVKAAPKVASVLEQIPTKVKSLFSKSSNTVDDVISQVDEVLGAAEIRAGAEATAPKITVAEKWAGVRPDIKKRLQGKPDQLSEYFDIAHARNLDDTVPTPLEWGAKKVESARDQLKFQLDDVGSDIGKFRTETAEQIIPSARAGTEIRNTFTEELGKLNLTLNSDGTIARLTNKVKKASDSEMKLLQSLHDDMLVLRERPTMENLIELRDAFGSQVNFAKTAQQASNVIDPLSRAVRAKIRDINIASVPPEQAKLLAQYSDTIEIVSELSKVVDSKSGAEFLLKRVLSERGRIPREQIQLINELTGIDLMDDAVMSQLATEIIGNQAQKGLFQQEITKAGIGALDILAIAKGKVPVGIGATLLEKGKKLIAPIEETFLKAAGEQAPKVKKGIDKLKGNLGK